MDAEPLSAPSHVAFMDIGTNSVRLLVVRLEPNHAYRVLTDQKEVVRLGEEEFADQRMHPAAIERAVLVCRRFAQLLLPEAEADAVPPEEVVAQLVDLFVRGTVATNKEVSDA